MFDETLNLPWTSTQWAVYFEQNARNLLTIPWPEGVTFTDQQRAALADSLAEFQLGESGEGQHLVNCARQFAATTGDHVYVLAMQRFMAEEARHSRDLGRVLDLASVPRLRSTWADVAFRFLGSRAKLELAIAIVMTAEILAKIYYAAVREASNSLVLRRLCDQILCDEQAHIRFQCERLAILRRYRSRLTLALRHGLHRCFFIGTSMVVWLKHRRALRAGGCGMFDYCRAAWEDLELAIRQMNPREYAFRAPDMAAHASVTWETGEISSTTGRGPVASIR